MQPFEFFFSGFICVLSIEVFSFNCWVCVLHVWLLIEFFRNFLLGAFFPFRCLDIFLFWVILLPEMIPVGWLVGWRVWCKFERPNDMILGVNMEMIWRHYDFPYFFYYIPSVRL